MAMYYISIGGSVCCLAVIGVLSATANYVHVLLLGPCMLESFGKGSDSGSAMWSLLQMNSYTEQSGTTTATATTVAVPMICYATISNTISSQACRFTKHQSNV
jgi:hypothetical protein